MWVATDHVNAHEKYTITIISINDDVGKSYSSQPIDMRCSSVAQKLLL